MDGDLTVEAVWVTMGWANPCIMKGGYLLRSPEVTPEGFWCDPWVHVILQPNGVVGGL